MACVCVCVFPLQREDKLKPGSSHTKEGLLPTLQVELIFADI